MNKSHCFLHNSSHSNWGVISRQDTFTSRTHWHGNARAAWRFDGALVSWACNAWCDFVRYVPTLANRHSAAVRSAGLEGGDIFVPAWMDLDLNGLVSVCLPPETGGKIASKHARHLGKQVDFRMHADWQGRMNFPCHSCHCCQRLMITLIRTMEKSVAPALGINALASPVPWVQFIYIYTYTHSAKTNLTPGNWWLEDYFPFTVGPSKS